MKKIALLSMALGLTGCMTVNEGLLRRTEIPENSKNDILIELKSGELIQKHNGQGINQGVLSGTTVINNVGKSFLSLWKSKGVISDYGVAGDLEKSPDYTLMLSGVKNEDSNLTIAVLSGLAFGLIPVSATLTYDLDVDLVNNRTQQHFKTKVKNAVTTWTQILLLPALPFSFIGSYNMLSDMSAYTYDELYKQGAFK